MVNGSEKKDRPDFEISSRDDHRSKNEPKRPRFERDMGLGRYRRTTELGVVFVTGVGVVAVAQTERGQHEGRVRGEVADADADRAAGRRGAGEREAERRGRGEPPSKYSQDTVKPWSIG